VNDAAETAALRAPTSAHHQRGASPRRAYALRPATNC